MADYDLRVVEKTLPRVIFGGTTAWKDRNGQIKDLTGYTVKLVVKPNLLAPDADAIFDEDVNLGDDPTGQDATKSQLYVDLTFKHTGLAPGSYPGELRAWASGPTTDPPTDAKTVNFIVLSAVKKSEL